MNLLAHTYVAMASGDNAPGYLLGAVLPDLASMARVRIDRSRLPAPLARGVHCHVRADAAFHGHPQFIRGAAAIRDDVAERGVAHGAARAIGHVGWELLLDGRFVGSPVHRAHRRALAEGQQALAAVRVADRPRWARFLSLRDRAAELRYDEPPWVAERLLQVLAPRPRLRFAAEQLPAVAEVLERHAARVADVADDVLAATMRAMR
jgi:hypothetical protein